MSRPLRIELTKDTGDYPKGAQLGVESLADAKRLYPDHKVISYVDGSTYDPPEKSGKDDEPAKTGRDDADHG